MTSQTLKPCGTEAAYYRHRYNNEQPCQACVEGRKQAVRDRNGMRPFRPARCGTLSGRQRHLSRGEPVCRACNDAQAEYMRDSRRGDTRRRQRTRERSYNLTDRIYDFLQVDGGWWTLHGLAARFDADPRSVTRSLSALGDHVESRHVQRVLPTVRHHVVSDGPPVSFAPITGLKAQLEWRAR